MIMADFILMVPKRDRLWMKSKILLEQVEKIKNGEFDEWMIEAVINDLKLSQIKAI